MFFIGDTVTKEQANLISPVVLAFVGDAVYSLYVREKLAVEHTFKSGELNRLAVSEVKATAQADKVKKLLDYLTEEELAVYKRARNAKKPTKSKSASVAEYNMSTGFEALVGYLYITGDKDRLNEILHYGEEDEN
ncbi:MAG: Mini-ribonuclease 3 [Clostridia bacterium]|nr:Mini-ribonuclease 3 [Clostridia bacterium]